MAKVLLLALAALVYWGYRNVRLKGPDRRRAREQAGPPPPAPRAELDPYEVLGLARGASQEDIRRAYHERAREYHPDTLARAAPELRRIAERRMAAINEAYRRLRTD